MHSVSVTRSPVDFRTCIARLLIIRDRLISTYFDTLCLLLESGFRARNGKKPILTSRGQAQV
ncbi:protein of unknown function (plasmid) [Pararobbsia alpina]